MEAKRNNGNFIPYIMAGEGSDFIQAEKSILRNATRAETLAHMALRLNNRLDFESVVKTVCEEVIHALKVPAAWINLFDREKDVLVFTDSVGLPAKFGRHYESPSKAMHDEFTRFTGPIMVISDVQDMADIPNADLFSSINAHTLASADISHAGQLIGTLNVLTTGSVRHFDDHELTLLEDLAMQSASAIVNAQLYEESTHRLKKLNALRTIDQAITGSFDMRVTLKIALEQVTTLLEVDAADVLLLDAPTQTMIYTSGRGFHYKAIERIRLMMGEEFPGDATSKRQRVFIPNLKTAGKDYVRACVFAEEGFVTYLCVPLITKGEIKGVLEVFHRRQHPAGREWLEFLEILARQIAIAVDSAQLFSNLQHSNDELLHAYDATIESLSQALDLRDKDTEGHSTRVTEMTINLARAMNMTDAELTQVRRGALLHDIGKLGVPDSILLKPGPLTEEEWSTMKQHCLYANNILSPIEFLRAAIDIPYCHHEKWDGSGYPRGLKGEEIPLAARLFAVVDVWDALCFDRPYRKAWNIEKVLDHIKSLSGTHFDPQAVDLFLEIHKKIVS